MRRDYEPYGASHTPNPAPDATGDGLFDETLHSLHEADAPFYDEDKDETPFDDLRAATAEEAIHNATLRGAGTPLPASLGVDCEPTQSAAGDEATPPMRDSEPARAAIQSAASARLEVLEAIITHNVGAIEEALWEIKKDGLHKLRGYRSFDTYVRERWQGMGENFSQGRMRQLVSSGKTRETLKSVTNGNKTLEAIVDKMPERQVREFTSVPEEHLLTMLETATQIVEAKPAPVGKAALYNPKPRATAADFAAAKASVLGTPTPPRAPSHLDAFFGDNVTTGVEGATETDEDDEDEPQEIVYAPHEFIQRVQWEADCHRLRFQVVTGFTVHQLWITESQLIEAGLPTMPEEAQGDAASEEWEGTF